MLEFTSTADYIYSARARGRASAFAYALDPALAFAVFEAGKPEKDQAKYGRDKDENHKGVGHEKRDGIVENANRAAAAAA
jgi:hypothetical protein